jgi:hypothetical protein
MAKKDTKKVLKAFLKECDPNIGLRGFSEETDMKKLITFWKKSNSPLRKRIEVRMLEVLPDTTYISEFITWWMNLPRDYDYNQRKLIEVAVSNVLQDTTDIGKLITWWETWWKKLRYRSYPDECKSVEARMSVILRGDADMSELITWWNKTSTNSKPRKLIEAKMQEVLKGIIDGDKLLIWRQETRNGSEPKKLIDASMLDVVNNITIDNIPGWFIDQLKNSSNVPVYFKESFQKKAEELYSQM